MSALLHAIIVGIENDRIKAGIRRWAQTTYFSMMAKGFCISRYFKDGQKQMGFKDGESWGENPVLDYIATMERHFKFICDECNIGLSKYGSRRTYYRSIKVLGEDCKEMDWYNLCWGCERDKLKQLYSNLCDKCLCEGYKVELDEDNKCIMCESEDDDSSSEDESEDKIKCVNCDYVWEDFEGGSGRTAFTTNNGYTCCMCLYGVEEYIPNEDDE